MGEKPYNCHPCGKSYGLLSVLRKHQKLHERKGDKTRIVTAPKGRRGTLSYIDYVDVETKSSLPTTEFGQTLANSSSEPYNHISDFTSNINAYQDQTNYQALEPIRNADVSETESIAMDILGLLDDEQRSDKPMEETLHKTHF